MKTTLRLIAGLAAVLLLVLWAAGSVTPVSAQGFPAPGHHGSMSDRTQDDPQAQVVAHGQGPVLMSGITTCPLQAKMSFSSPLTPTPTADSTTVSFTAKALVSCTNRFQGNVRMVRGYLNSLTGTIAPNTTCFDFLSGLTAPALAGGSVKWTPSPKIAASTGISFPSGSMIGLPGELNLQYSAGSVDGSYPTDAAMISAASNADIATLTNLCNTGLDFIGFSGNVSL